MSDLIAEMPVATATETTEPVIAPLVTTPAEVMPPETVDDDPEEDVPADESESDDYEDDEVDSRLEYLKNYQVEGLPPFAVAETLAMLGGGSVRGILRTRMITEQNYFKNSVEGSPEALEHKKNIQEMEQLFPMAEKNSSLVQTRLEQLRKSSRPEVKALAMDIGIALNAQETQSFKQILADLESNLPRVDESKKEAALLEIQKCKNHIRQMEVEQERSKIAREGVKIAGITLPNQAAAASMELIKALENKTEFTDHEIEEIDENPLGPLTTHFTRMINNPEVAQTNIGKLISKGLISQTDGQHLMTSFIQMKEAIAKGKTAGDYVLPTLGLLMGLFYLILQRSMASEAGGQRGH